MKKALIISVVINIAVFGYFTFKKLSPVSAGIQVNPPLAATTTLRIDSAKIGKIKRVLILGNSIVKHPSLPAIGWNNNWGMAASSIDSDFVHILIRDIKSKDASREVMFENIADFEREFDAYDFNKAKVFRDFNPDLVVMRICENINADMAVKKGLIKYYDSLLTFIDPSARSVRVVVGGFWQNDAVVRMLHDYAYLKGHTFIDQTGIYGNETKALGLYKDLGVQEHPNNLGMQKIAESIWSAIRIYFP